MLDQSINAVEVTDQDQFFEILCTHAIVDRSSGKISTPRFFVYVIGGEALQKPAGREAAFASESIMNLDMSPIGRLKKSGDPEDEKEASD